MTQQKSPLAWLGGKSRLADQIIERMPAHQAYCEVFAGAAWVLFKKPPSKVEIINDINRELTNLYRCLKHHLGELVASVEGNVELKCPLPVLEKLPLTE